MIFDLYFIYFFTGPHVIQQYLTLSVLTSFITLIFYCQKLKNFTYYVALLTFFHCVIYYEILAFHGVENWSTYISYILQTIFFCLVSALTAYAWVRTSFHFLLVRYAAVINKTVVITKENEKTKQKENVRPRTMVYWLRTIFISLLFLGSDIVIEESNFPVGLVRTYLILLVAFLIFYALDRKKKILSSPEHRKILSLPSVTTLVEEWSTPAEFDLAHFYWIFSVTLMFITAYLVNFCKHTNCPFYSSSLYYNAIALWSLLLLLILACLFFRSVIENFVKHNHYRCTHMFVYK